MMSPTIDHRLRPPSTTVLFDAAQVGEVLRSCVPPEWQNQGRLTDTRVERCWPSGLEGILVEWSFVLRDGRRYKLFGVPDGREANSESAAVGARPRITPKGLRGVSAYVPEWGLRIHSPDRDPGLPHLATCLDAAEMTDRFAAARFGSRANGRPAVCDLLGYRAGRRAAIRYPSAAGEATRDALVGKTYRDDRGRSLLHLHDRLNRELSCGRVQSLAVPEPIGFVDDLQMALLSWEGNAEANGYSSPLDEHRIATASRALALLHGLSIDALPLFDAAKECAIVERWHRLLGRVNRRHAAMTEPLVESLLNTGATLDAGPACLIHRDFYEKQLIVSGSSATLLDLDTMAMGSPCVDLGNYLAHLLLHVVQRGWAWDVFDNVADALMHTYALRAERVDGESLGFYLRSSLFRLGAVHACRAATGRYAPALWRYAMEPRVVGESNVRRHRPKANRDLTDRRSKTD